MSVSFWNGIYLGTVWVGLTIAASSCGPAPIELYQTEPAAQPSPVVIYVQPSAVPCDCPHCEKNKKK